ncbi:hypothetical protein [Desulfotalea psychrophila]|nr:hypothetical protein [Desulfotalea psychrophila]
MNKVTIGVLFCLVSLILMHNGRAGIGILIFSAGIILMNKK